MMKTSFFKKTKSAIRSVATPFLPLFWGIGGPSVISRVNKTFNRYSITLQLDPKELIDQTYLAGRVNSRSIDFLSRLCSIYSCEYFIDGGCNQGFYTFALASLHADLACISIDPDPYNHEKFRFNMILNPNISRRIELLEGALSDDTGHVKLMLNTAGNRGGSSLCIDQRKFTGKSINETITAPCINLPALIDGRKIDNYCLKLDIEGFEYPVLSNLLRSHGIPKPIGLVIEWTGSGITGQNGESPIDLLNSQGYLCVGNENNENFFFIQKSYIGSGNSF